MQTYQESIKTELMRSRDLRLMTIQPRLVEGWMRLEHGTLDALSEQQFNAEVRVCAACVLEADPAVSNGLAESCGL